MDAVTPTARSPFRVLGIVLNYNGGDDVIDCVRSLRAQSHAPFDLLVIDNASTDGSIDALEAACPDVERIRNESNLGFCAGNNAGLRLALERGYNGALLLNNDVELDAECVSHMVHTMAAVPAIDVVGPKVLFDPERGKIWAAGGRVNHRQNLNRLRGFGMPAGVYSRSGDVDYVPGCAMLIRCALLRDIGFLDEDYFAYLEDVEFCQRAKAAGRRVFYEASARVYHRVSRASGARYGGLRKYLNARNSVLYLRRHGTLVRWMKFVLYDICTLPAAWFVRALRGESGAVAAKWRGILAGFRGQRGAPPEREWPPA